MGNHHSFYDELMQQLLGNKAQETDNAFLCKLFLQHLPSNVGMILASTSLLLLLLLLLLLAQVTYNQVQPLRINYLASSHRGIIALIVSSKIV